VLVLLPCSEVLEGANELRVMLCRDKLVQSGSGLKRGTSVIAACGEQSSNSHSSYSSTLSVIRPSCRNILEQVRQQWGIAHHH
jgi:hypothetical protein